jgi:serine protease inhibitor
MNSFHQGLLAALLATSAAGQSPDDKDRASAGDENRVSGVEIAAVVDGHNRFAWEAYGRLRQTPGNLGFSPFSLACGLAMIQAGARGETADQIGEVLHLPADEAAAHRALGMLRRGLSGDAGPRGVKLTSTSSLWARKDLGVPPEYVALIKDHYQSTVNEADFEADPEAARRAVNAWVKAQTEGAFAEIFKPGDLSGQTQLVLADVLAFQGTWAAAFKKERTEPGAFRVSPGRQVEVPFMRQIGKFRVAVTAAGQALELPYTGHDLAFVVLLPRRADGLAELEKHLSGPFLSDWLRQLKPETVAVSLPRFTVSAELRLENVLAQLGMPLAFRSLGSDFSGLCSSDEPVALSDVAQHVRIKVDEAGTEAVAVTAIRSSRGLGNLSLREFKADRPFVFFLRDLRTGSILFLGRLTDPGVRKRDEM